ncbi:hypothetical protein SAMN05444166_5115 [Singulisphaera sp. GP187]|nr:hypothetical protein SAMN05444166_5115 [Singulisphaera sp. GP187]
MIACSFCGCDSAIHVETLFLTGPKTAICEPCVAVAVLEIRKWRGKQ